VEAQFAKENIWINDSLDYMIEALEINNALSLQYEEDVAISKQYEKDVAISKKRRNEVKGSLEKRRKMIKSQGDILERGIKYIILCRARDLQFTWRWGGV
jgi:hypothetical protein